MKCFSRVEVLGYLGCDPELYRNQAGLPIVRLSIGVSTEHKDPSGKQVSCTEWVKVVLFRQLADRAVKYLKKGSLVLVAGKLHTRKYQDQDQKTCNSVEVLGYDFIMFPKSSDTVKVDENQGTIMPELEPIISLSSDNDIPF